MVLEARFVVPGGASCDSALKLSPVYSFEALAGRGCNYGELRRNLVELGFSAEGAAMSCMERFKIAKLQPLSITGLLVSVLCAFVQLLLLYLDGAAYTPHLLIGTAMIQVLAVCIGIWFEPRLRRGGDFYIVVAWSIMAAGNVGAAALSSLSHFLKAHP